MICKSKLFLLLISIVVFVYFSVKDENGELFSAGAQVISEYQNYLESMSQPLSQWSPDLSSL